IVYENERSAFCGEHSCMDGTPTLRMNEYILASLSHSKVPLGPPTVASPSTLPPPTEIIFQTTPQIDTLIAASCTAYDTLVSSHDLQVQHYEGYGKSLIKSHNISPDAWAQLTKQLVFHKLHGRMAVTYESAQTRRFQRGRTETIRSLSAEATAFVSAMVSLPPRLPFPLPHPHTTPGPLPRRRSASQHLRRLGGRRPRRRPPHVRAQTIRAPVRRRGRPRLPLRRRIRTLEPLGAEHKPAE
ncbi:hypothetical protein C0992_004875, partial [Termitomyces sp. T32_za158]